MSTAGKSSRACAKFQLSASLFAGLLVLIVGGWAGCSALIDFDECHSESDCVSRHSRGWTCTDDGLCQKKALLSSEEGPCTQTIGDIDADNAFHVGVLLPLSGPEEGFGRPLLNAIELAWEHFDGLKGIDGRPVALIVCDTEGNDDRALEGARHLVHNAGVEAIIGPDYSSQTIAIAQELTIDHGVVLVTPSGTATTISGLDDDNLVWRTTPSDTLQGRAMGELVATITDEMSTDVPDAKVGLLVRENDVYAEGLRDGVIEYLPANIRNDDSGARFGLYSYQNASAGGGSDYSGVIGQVLADSVDTGEPNVVVILGSSEAWTIAEELDQELSSEPIFVFADAAKNTDAAQNAPSQLQERIWGTAPRNNGDDNYAPWRSFKSGYRQKYQANAGHLQFSANAYDALYVIGLGAAGTDFSGPAIARGIGKLSQGETVNANQSDLSAGLRVRAGGESVDLQGASGPLDFNADGDPTVGEVSLWCLDGTSLPERGVILDRDGQYRALSCQSNACNVDEDCGDGFGCEAGTCLAECNEDQDCMSDQSCVDRQDASGRVCQ